MIFFQWVLLLRNLFRNEGSSIGIPNLYHQAAANLDWSGRVVGQLSLVLTSFIQKVNTRIGLGQNFSPMDQNASNE
jgi:hypothetical protein